MPTFNYTGRGSLVINGSVNPFSATYKCKGSGTIFLTGDVYQTGMRKQVNLFSVNQTCNDLCRYCNLCTENFGAESFQSQPFYTTPTFFNSCTCCYTALAGDWSFGATAFNVGVSSANAILQCNNGPTPATVADLTKPYYYVTATPNGSGLDTIHIGDAVRVLGDIQDANNYKFVEVLGFDAGSGVLNYKQSLGFRSAGVDTIVQSASSSGFASPLELVIKPTIYYTTWVNPAGFGSTGTLCALGTASSWLYAMGTGVNPVPRKLGFTFFSGNVERGANIGCTQQITPLLALSQLGVAQNLGVTFYSTATTSGFFGFTPGPCDTDLDGNQYSAKYQIENPYGGPSGTNPGWAALPSQMPATCTALDIEGFYCSVAYNTATFPSQYSLTVTISSSSGFFIFVGALGGNATTLPDMSQLTAGVICNGIGGAAGYCEVIKI